MCITFLLGIFVSLLCNIGEIGASDLKPPELIFYSETTMTLFFSGSLCVGLTFSYAEVFTKNSTDQTENFRFQLGTTF